jgi:hypothetical protein
VSSKGSEAHASGAQEKLPTGIPMFDGRLEHFEDFRYKLTACFLELGLDEITFKPHADVLAARDKPLTKFYLTETRFMVCTYT